MPPSDPALCPYIQRAVFHTTIQAGPKSTLLTVAALKMEILESASFDTWTLAIWALTLLALVWVIRTIYVGFQPGLRGIPGPWSARFANAVRFKLVWAGRAHENYRQLHETYGAIVRTAPNVVDISDPEAIPIIYGINSKYLKASAWANFLYKSRS
jgi:hypothetical protein